jgi:hypothetical protein
VNIIGNTNLPIDHSVLEEANKLLHSPGGMIKSGLLLHVTVQIEELTYSWKYGGLKYIVMIGILVR